MGSDNLETMEIQYCYICKKCKNKDSFQNEEGKYLEQCNLCNQTRNPKILCDCGKTIKSYSYKKHVLGKMHKTLLNMRH